LGAFSFVKPVFGCTMRTATRPPLFTVTWYFGCRETGGR